MDMENVIKGLECHQIDKDHRINCSDCPYHCDEFMNGLNELHNDAIALLKVEQKFRTVMFNRCATATMRLMDKNACEMCIFRDDCEKERTVNPW